MAFTTLVPSLSCERLIDFPRWWHLPAAGFSFTAARQQCVSCDAVMHAEWRRWIVPIPVAGNAYSLPPSPRQGSWAISGPNATGSKGRAFLEMPRELPRGRFQDIIGRATDSHHCIQSCIQSGVLGLREWLLAQTPSQGCEGKKKRPREDFWAPGPRVGDTGLEPVTPSLSSWCSILQSWYRNFS